MGHCRFGPVTVTLMGRWTYVSMIALLLGCTIAALAGSLIAASRRAERRALRRAAELEQQLEHESRARRRRDDEVRLLAALAARGQVVLDQQIDRLIELERDAPSTTALDALVALDHLAGQARRSVET